MMRLADISVKQCHDPRGALAKAIEMIVNTKQIGSMSVENRSREEISLMRAHYAHTLLRNQ